MPIPSAVLGVLLCGSLITAQQTFQNTIFDLPAQLGGEPVGVAAQAQGAPLFVQQPDQKPPTAPVPQTAAPLPQAVATTPSPFTFPTMPTLAPFTLPSHPTIAPFTLPSHPTIAPFTFPTHQPLVFTTPAPYLPPSPYNYVQQSQYNAYPPQYQQQQFQQQNYYNQYNQQQQQQSAYPQQQQQQYYNNYNNGVQTPQGQAAPSQAQAPLQVQPPAQVQSFESNSQVVRPVLHTVQQNAEVVKPVMRPAVNSVPTRIVDTESSSKKAENFNKQTGEQPKTATIEKANLETAVDVNIDRHIWFSADYDVKQCRQNLNGIGVRFQKKFPSYLQKGGKDRELAELVEQRLLECERKSTASHWDKVDSLLQKINLTKSEEGECRAGLIQERISCVNLLKFACQFVDSAYHFKLVPARITIQEARQAESGAEKCRQVVRIVKQRLESGAVTL